MWTAQTAHRLICARGDVAVTCGVGERARGSGDLGCALDDSVCTLPEQSVQSSVLLTLHRESRKGPRLHAHSINASAHRGFVRQHVREWQALRCGVARRGGVLWSSAPARRQDKTCSAMVESSLSTSASWAGRCIRSHTSVVTPALCLNERTCPNIDSRAKLLREKCPRRAQSFVNRSVLRRHRTCRGKRDARLGASPARARHCCGRSH
jgi:hypothetical protein